MRTGVWLWFLMLCLLSGRAGASDNILVLDTGAREVPVGFHLQILEDPSTALDIAGALKAMQEGRFESVTQTVPSKGFSPSAWWGHFRLRHEAMQSQLWLLDFSYVPMQQLDVYVVQGNEGAPEVIGHYRGGTSVPVAERPFPHRTYITPLTLEPEALLDVYVRVAGQSSKIMPLELVRSDHFAQRETTEYILFGIHIGILLGLSIYNLFLFAFVRDITYAVYVASVVTALLFFLSLTGVGSLYLWPESTWIGSAMVPISMGSSVASSAFFCAMFLGTRQNTPRVHRLLVTVAIVAFLSVIGAFFLPYKVVTLAGIVCTVLGSLLALLAGVLTLRKGLEEARYYLVAWSLFLLGALALVLKVAGILPPVFFAEYGMFIGSAMECTFLSVALAARMRTLKRDKEAAQQDALQQKQTALDTVTHYSRKLEEDVRLRTQELLDAQQKLVAHEKRSALGVFTAGMAHEINNPANFVSAGVQNAASQLQEFQNFVNDIIEGENSEISAEFGRRFDTLGQSLELAQGGIKRIDTVIRKLRATHPEGIESVQSVDVVAQLEDAWSLLDKQSLDGLQVALRFESRQPVPAQISEANEMFLALLANALDAMRDRVAMDHERYVPVLTLSSRAEPGFLVVSVGDNGTGIPQPILDKVFDPFFTTKAVGKGSGLGLAIVRDMMNKRGGRVGLVSREGEGTVVSLFWPTAKELS